MGLKRVGRSSEGDEEEEEEEVLFAWHRGDSVKGVGCWGCA